MPNTDLKEIRNSAILSHGSAGKTSLADAMLAVAGAVDVPGSVDAGQDAKNNFLPAIGKVEKFIPASGAGIRVDSGIESGNSITIHYDPMIAKLIVYENNRQAAIERMRYALRETVILGTTTNIDFLQSLLEHPVFLAGEITTRYVDENLDALLPQEKPLPPVALIVAALSESQGKSSQVLVQADGSDAYSPWNRGDSFRLGE